MVAIPHFDLPFRVTGAGSFAVVEQDSPDDLANCVAVVIATPEGSRVEVPDFGSPRPEFDGPDGALIVAAVEEWEPRVDLSVEVLVGLDPVETLTTLRAFVHPHL